MYGFSTTRPLDAGQMLVLQQARQIASLVEANRQLTAIAVSAGTGSRGPKRPSDPRREKMRGLEFEVYAFECYLPGTNHATDSAVAEICRDLFVRINSCFPFRRPLLRDVNDRWIERFRNHLAMRIGERFSPATANKYLRQLRAIANYAARKRLIRRPAEIDFLKQPERDVPPLSLQQLAALEAQARNLSGFLSRSPFTGPKSQIPLAIFWTALLMVLARVGSRITATMLARREDYDRETRSLLLRAETQKQGRDQQIALPPRAAAAVERLLEAHDHALIFGCWPHDPPPRRGRRKWKTLAGHFRRLLAEPAGIALPRRMVFHIFRHTAATLCKDHGGDPQELLGHASPATTRIYTRRARRTICRQSLVIPDPDPQQALF
jgi:integrase